MNTLGDRIRSERKAKRLTMEALGKMVGVSKSSVSQWESGLTKEMDGRNLVSIAKIFDVDPYWLSTGNGNKYGAIEGEVIRNVLPGQTFAEKCRSLAGCRLGAVR